MMKAQAQPPMKPVSAAEVFQAGRRTTRGPSLARLGALSGLLTGLALAVGVWLPEALALGPTHTRLVFPLMVLGALGVCALTTLAGWLVARGGSGAAAALGWGTAALLVVLLLGHLPYDGRTLLIWIIDPRFWGQSLYPFEVGARARMWLGGFFVGLALGLVGLVQNYRLEGVRGSLNRGRLSLRTVVLLLLPLPLLALAGWVADENLNRPLRVAPLLVAEALSTGRTYTGDLAALGEERGVNYRAINGVRELIGEAGYSLQLVNIGLGPADTVFVRADFDNGAWVYCRVLADQLAHCFDASPPYTRGLAGLLSGAGTPDCAACAVTVSADLAAWLRLEGARFAGPPEITRVAQWGSQVIMRVSDPSGYITLECDFVGLGPYHLTGCREV